MHCSFYTHFIEKPIKYACEDIPLQKISIACSQAHLLYLQKMLKNNEQRYPDLVNLFKKFYSTLETKKQYKQAEELRKSVKNDLNLYEKKMEEKKKAAQFKGSVMSFWETALLSTPIKKTKDNTPSITCSSKTSSKATLSQTKTTEFIELGMFC